MHRSVVVRQLSGSAEINPTPLASEDCESLLERYLSPERLRELTGCEDLQHVTTLEMSVDTQENTLGNFGTFLPSLVQLKMNNSLIMSVRDLGTSLSHLCVLWVVRCGLSDLDGIPSFSSLKELYAAYNDISDLSPVSMLEHLELLDLEGNNVDDLVQAAPYCYRSAVRELVPQLCYLDDIPAEETEPLCSTSSLEDWDLLKESIKERLLDGLAFSEENVTGGVPSYRPCSAPLSLSRSANRPGSDRPSSAYPRSRPSSADDDPVFVDPDASDLTHGMGQVMCGNPVQALRERRQKLTRPGSCSPTLLQLPLHPPSYTPWVQAENVRESGCEAGGMAEQDRSGVFAELRAWREEHSRRLMAMEMDRLPQVKVSHSDTEEEGKGSSISCTSEEEEGEEGKGRKAGSHHWKSTDSSDSSFQSPTPATPCPPVSPGSPSRRTPPCAHPRP